MYRDEIKDAINNGKLNVISDVVNRAINDGASNEDILDCMIKAMDDVGEKFQNNDIYVPDMLIAAKTMERGVSILKPRFTSQGSDKKNGKVIIGTVSGDLHDIGKNLVSVMIQSQGVEVIDLGIDVPADVFIKAIKDNPDCKIVALSALLSFTLDSMRETVDLIKASKVGKRVKILVGGAPVSKEFAERIGADYYTRDAVDAARTVKQILSEN